ncbi:MAG: metal dependent phosphohydrolase [Lachnospiraceae bacterium]|nr:metal dependent phosphohydrolase [Lachnospiraceae bacterium]
MLQNVLNSLELSKMDYIAKADFLDAIDHGVLVSKLAVALSKELGMEEAFVYQMGEAGMVHDIGKLRLGYYLYGRNKDALEIEEIKYVRMHPAIGYDILNNYGYEDVIAETVYHHHENYDGTGYPGNLKGDSIPVGARILRTCDVFAALSSKRLYRPAYDIETAIRLMIDEVKNFDMEIFLAFLRVSNSENFDSIRKFIQDINNKKTLNSTVTFMNLNI